MEIKGINREFLHRFVLQVIRVYAKREKLRQVEILESGNLPFIRRRLIRPVMRRPQLPVQTPTQIQAPLKKRIELGKLTPLIENKEVDYIECEGPDKSLKVMRNSKISEVDISLNSKEIEEVISKFSEKTTAPVEKVFRAVFAGLRIDAIKSDVLGYRFIILKEKQNPEI